MNNPSIANGRVLPKAQGIQRIVTEFYLNLNSHLDKKNCMKFLPQQIMINKTMVQTIMAKFVIAMPAIMNMVNAMITLLYRQ